MAVGDKRDRQRLNLTKVSIIAKDVSNSIELDLGLSEEEKYHKRLALKMDLLRDHLKTYISSEFSPSMPSTITSSIGVLLGSSHNKETKED